MARWKRRKTATFGDMPQRLVDAEDDAAKQERNEWLEAKGLALVDFMSWKREQNSAAKLRPPARRRLLRPQERAELDARLEREGFQW